jgi:hypothetical protein
VYQPNRPNRFDPRELPPEYRPRVIVKFRDDARPPALDDRPLVASATTPRTPAPAGEASWEALTRTTPGSSVSRLYRSASEQQLRELMASARSSSGNARIPNLLNFFAVSLPRGANPQSVISAVSRWSGVQTAYVEPPPVPPPVVNAADDPRASTQGYLAAAPGGINARHAWTVPGGDGAGVDFIDVEQGWTLNHEDLTGRHITLISGVNHAYFGHGTSVLGEVGAEDNRLGIVGIAPAARMRVVSEWRSASNYDTSDAIISAIVNLHAGDVLLIEAQTTVYMTSTSSWSTHLPVEVYLHTWAAIAVATARGIVVVEAGGNGSNNLDTWSHPTDGFILKRGHAQFRESGAIMVGAASDSVPHRRLGLSNCGSRIDCYAWGQNIMTTGDGWTGTATNTYSNFSGTSGASPIIAGAALALQGMVKSATGAPWSPSQVRRALSNPRNGTASATPASDRIGVMPDLLKLHSNEVTPLRPATTPPRRRLPAGAGDYPAPRGDTRVASYGNTALARRSDPDRSYPAQACFHEDTPPDPREASLGWESSAFAVEALTDDAPAELRELLAYLHVDWATFSPRESAYFAGLSELLRRQGVVPASTTLDRTSFRGAVRAFQAARHQNPDGIPGESTLWELQKAWADGRNLAITRVDADRHPGSDGYDNFRLRADIVDRYTRFRAEVRRAGGIVTSAGSFRDLGATVTPGRSATSMHYSGLAFDLATDTGMHNPARDPYIITQEGGRWRLWCRSASAPSQTLDAVVWRDGLTTTRSTTLNAFDFTALAARCGFSSIGPRRAFPGDYMSAEWWHFQCEAVLTPYISQFGIELLSLAQYDEAHLSRHTDIWSNRQHIFKRGQHGWW